MGAEITIANREDLIFLLTEAAEQARATAGHADERGHASPSFAGR